MRDIILMAKEDINEALRLTRGIITLLEMLSASEETTATAALGYAEGVCAVGVSNK